MPWEGSLYTLQCWIMASFERKAAAKWVFFPEMIWWHCCVYVPFMKVKNHIISWCSSRWHFLPSIFIFRFVHGLSVHHLSTSCNPRSFQLRVSGSEGDLIFHQPLNEKTSLFTSNHYLLRFGVSLVHLFRVPYSYRTSVTLCVWMIEGISLFL